MKIRLAAVLVALLTLFGCGSSSVEDIIDVIEGVERRQIDTSRAGLNAFANQAFAGSICAQYAEIANTLRINKVRVLFNWDDNVQPTPGSPLNFSFYDDILDCIPAGVDALVILTNIPSWMSNPANWIDGNPRTTFAERWVSPVVTRYQGNGKIVGYQIWNEPNNNDFPENNIMQVLTSPQNYVELIAASSAVVKSIEPGRRVISGSTTSIAQNFPDTLDYNRGMRDAGIDQHVDIIGIHYYGKSFERLILEVRDFLNSLSRPLWVTESGRMGVTEQLAYVEEVWPFLREQVPGIDRIYYYIFAENTPAGSTFGLRNPDGSAPVSDLYIFLRDR